MSGKQPPRHQKPIPSGVRYDSEQLGEALKKALVHIICPIARENRLPCPACLEHAMALVKPVALAVLKAASYKHDFKADVDVAAGQAVELLLKKGGVSK